MPNTEDAIRRAPSANTGGAAPAVAPDAQTLATGAVDRIVWRDHVWSADDLKPTDKLVALAYADHAGRTTSAVWVAPERLEAMTGLSRSGRKNAIRRLVAAGWLVMSQPARQHRAARYSLLVPTRDDGSPRALLDPVDNSPSGSPRDPEPNQNPTQPPDTRATPPDELADVRDRNTRELVGVIYDKVPQRLTSGLTQGRLRANAEQLRAAGWRPATLADALNTAGFDAAKATGFVLHVLERLAAEGPPRPPDHNPKTTRRACPDHGPTFGTCTGCAGDHNAGEHREHPSRYCHLCPDRKTPA